MDLLELYFDAQLIGAYSLFEAPLEVGSAQDCDVVVPGLAPRHFLIFVRAGTVIAWDVSLGKRSRGRGHHLPLGGTLALTERYRLRRRGKVPSATTPSVEPRTSADRPLARPALVVLAGRGTAAIRLRVNHEPVHIGRHADNDLMLPDARVSGHHCRLEPSVRGVVVRDLGSTNGTFVNGARVRWAVVGEGARIRVGATELQVVADTDDGHGGGMIAESDTMRRLLADVHRLAPLSWPVLVVGESGAGKEGVARALHEHSARGGGPFVAVNAGGRSAALIESELFGHERGAFTGAAERHRGLFEQADGGTLFLDEVGELPPLLQARLLRVLETAEVRRVGGESALRVDVRLVCATHRHLPSLVGEGGFRKDLYYRIARLVLEVPALRSRPEDVRALARHFLREIAPEVGPRELSPAAMSVLLAHAWPGNVRELRNVLCAAGASTTAPRLDALDVKRALQRLNGAAPALELELSELRDAVEANSGNLAAAARALGIPRTTLRDRLQRGPAPAAGGGRNLVLSAEQGRAQVSK